jgi:anti-anti-sigma factor
MDTLGGNGQRPDLQLDRVDGPDGLVCVAVRGEIDLVTGERFRDLVMRVLGEPGVARLQLDLSALRFIDSNGVTVLVKARRLADEQGITFGVVRVDGAIRDLLEMLGVHGMLALDQPFDRSS